MRETLFVFGVCVGAAALVLGPVALLMGGFR